MDTNVIFGIMTIALPRKDSPLSSAGNYVPPVTWRHFHLAGLRHGLKVIFFHPEDVDFIRNRVHAWFCTSQEGMRGWKREWYRIPDVLYENVVLHALRRTRALDMKKEFRKIGIPTFNPALFQKSKLFDILQRNKAISQHIPKTSTVQQAQDIITFLQQAKCVYLKPVRGSGGKGIIELSLNGRIVRVRSQRFHKNKRYDRSFPIEKLHSFLHHLISKDRYIMQEGLNLLTRDGRKIDFRFQVNRNETGKWHLIGIRPKLGPVGSIVSNLHSGGIEGDFDEIAEWAAKTGYSFPDKNSLVKVAIATAELFTRYRGNLSHIGIDIAVDDTGHFFVLDVNPRPGRHILTPSMREHAIDSMTGFAKYLCMNQ